MKVDVLAVSIRSVVCYNFNDIASDDFGLLENEREREFMNALDKFGKIFVTETRDMSIHDIDKMIDGTMKGDSAKKIQDKIINFTDEQKEILKFIVSQTVDNVLDNFLLMIEQHEKIGLSYDNINLSEESDGLSGELYTEDGWIEKYSSQRK